LERACERENKFTEKMMSQEVMTSSAGAFWDHRCRAEGAIWGNGPIPTAELAARYLQEGDRVLEVGFGYGRDMCYLLQQRYRFFGIEASREGHRLTEDRLRHEGLEADGLMLSNFEKNTLADGSFEAVLCHRMLHLLVSRKAVVEFVEQIQRVLRRGGLLCVGVRNASDLDPTSMARVDDNVYEYTQRPGHRIRYWDDAAFHEFFYGAFTLLTLTGAVEQESASNLVPCSLTLMAGRKKQAVEHNGGQDR
jgi:SAM-dependent methyltransferase